MLQTERLTLRTWRDDDAEAYAALHDDPTVVFWLGGRLTHEQALSSFDTVRRGLAARGWGMLCVERNEDGAFLGVAGVSPLADDLPPAPGVEASWRMAPAAWGRGYMTEAMRAVLLDGFTRWDWPEVVSLTAASNRRSQALMSRLGFKRDTAADFHHPRLPEGHSMRPHVVYRLARR